MNRKEREALGISPGRGGPRGALFRPRVTIDQIADIKRGYEAGEPLATIAARNGVSVAYVSQLGTGTRNRRNAQSVYVYRLNHLTEDQREKLAKEAVGDPAEVSPCTGNGEPATSTGRCKA